MLKKIWHDPVWSKVISATIIFLAACAFTYFVGLWPSFKNFSFSETAFPNWFIFLWAIVTFVLIFVLKSHLSIKDNFKSEIQQLLLDVTDQNSSITSLLRRSKALAKKLKNLEFLDWIENELAGYKDLSPEKLPSYRKTHGELRAYNSYRGWDTVQFQDAETRELLTYAPLGQDISSFEEFSKGSLEKELVLSHSPVQKQIIFDFLKGCEDFQLVIGSGQVHRIIGAVRHSLQEQLLNIENK